MIKRMRNFSRQKHNSVFEAQQLRNKKEVIKKRSKPELCEIKYFEFLKKSEIYDCVIVWILYKLLVKLEHLKKYQISQIH